MSSYVARCACNGTHPRSVSTKDVVLRNELISKLMEDRNSVRIIKAPNGFGKSTLAAQYSEIVFSYADVYWFNCESPCFLRDLDNGSLCTQMNEVKLAVFDDLPHLDDDRVDKFILLLDDLSNASVEVLITVTPVNDTVSSSNPSSIIIDTNDLLLSDGEKEIFKIKDDIRIVSLKNNPYKYLLNCLIDEKFSYEIYSQVFLIYVFIEGNLGIFQSCEILKFLSDDYLYFGLDNYKKNFKVKKLDIYEICSVFEGYIDGISKFLNYKDKDHMAHEIAEKLLKHGNYGRAIRIVNAICTPKSKYSFLKKINNLALKNGNLLECDELYSAIISKNVQVDISSKVHEAWRKALLDDVGEAVKYAYKIIDDQDTSVVYKLMCCLIFIFKGSRQEVKQAKRLIRYFSTKLVSAASVGVRRQTLFIYKLALVMCDLILTKRNIYDFWCELEIDDSALVSAFYILKNYKIDNFDEECVSMFVRRLHRTLSTYKDHNLYFNFLSYEYIKLSKIYGYNMPKLNDELVVGVNKFMRGINKQISKYNTLKQASKFEDVPVSNYEIPKLYVELFGGLKVSLNGKEIINNCFKRQKVKQLMAMLVLENGNELNRHDVANVLWPGSSKIQKQRNLNALWCLLVNTVGHDYFNRSQSSFGINRQLVDSDIDKIDKLCSDMSMGPLDPNTWYECVENNKRLFESDLLPSETENKMICEKRSQFKNKVVDSYIGASKRLLEIGEERQSLWFAQRAIERDSKREDAYINLMEVQIVCEQRSPALNTYRACSEYLKNEFNIEPSAKMKKMYKKAMSEFC